MSDGLDHTAIAAMVLAPRVCLENSGAMALFGAGFEWGLQMALRHPEWARAACEESPIDRPALRGKETAEEARLVYYSLLDKAARAAAITMEEPRDNND